jgi:hypothetical protein
MQYPGRGGPARKEALAGANSTSIYHSPQRIATVFFKFLRGRIEKALLTGPGTLFGKYLM